jgi:hypothetical protein
VGSYAITGSGLTADHGNYTFVQAAANVTAFTVDAATLTVTPIAVSTTYSGVALNNTTYSDNTGDYSITGFVNGQSVASAGVTLSGSMAFNGSTATNVLNAGTYSQAVGTLALTSNNKNYVMTFSNTTPNNYVITPATLTYVAAPSTQFTGVPFSAFTGTVTGFVNGETLASATTGVLQFTSPATPASLSGSYGIFGSGLSANNSNYVFVQAASNATALTLEQPSQSTPSQFTATTNGTPNNPTNLNLTLANNSNTPIQVSFIPNTNQNSVYPGVLPPGDALTHNHGLNFPPISEYDPNQYSPFKLPDYDDKDGEVTILTIIARAIDQQHAADYMIDGFWNGTDQTWPGAGHISLLDKVSFFGGGHEGTPTNDPGFPIVAGKTDFAALLKQGPVMIGGVPGQSPQEWLLALNLAPDGKGIICDDPITGKLVELAYNQSTETLGGITAVFDPKTKGFVALADAGGDIPAGALNGLATLQGFVPSVYYTVAIH